MSRSIGVRVPDDLLEKIQCLSEEEGHDRSTTIRKLVQRGFEEIACEKAAEAYRQGRITLSQAAEQADLAIWEMETYLVHNGYQSDYSIRDLERELDVFDERERRP